MPTKGKYTHAHQNPQSHPHVMGVNINQTGIATVSSQSHGQHYNPLLLNSNSRFVPSLGKFSYLINHNNYYLFKSYCGIILRFNFMYIYGIANLLLMVPTDCLDHKNVSSDGPTRKIIYISIFQRKFLKMYE